MRRPAEEQEEMRRQDPGRRRAAHGDGAGKVQPTGSVERSGSGQRRDRHRQRRERVADVHLYASHAAVALNSLA